MSESIVKQGATLPPELASVVSPDSSVHLVATTPAEMTQAQGQLTNWFTLKAAACNAEAKELGEAVTYAKSHKWNYKALQAQHAKALRRRMFYEKCKAASEQGFCLIPNIPADVFAIRVKRTGVKAGETDTTSRWPVNPRDEVPDVIPAGEGRYESPNQLINKYTTAEKDSAGKDITRTHYYPTDFAEMEFPMIAARPAVMDATQRAMALRIFDQIGVSPQGRPKGDPMVLGQIVESIDKYGNSPKMISFLLAWNVDLRTL